jgi:hypothetical protein
MTPCISVNNNQLIWRRCPKDRDSNPGGRQNLLLSSVQISSGAHPNFYSTRMRLTGGGGSGCDVRLLIRLHPVLTLGMHGDLPPLLHTPSRRDFTCTSHNWAGRDMRNGNYDLRKLVSDTMLYCTRHPEFDFCLTGC